MPKSLVSGVEIVAMLNENLGVWRRQVERVERQGGFYHLILVNVRMISGNTAI